MEKTHKSKNMIATVAALTGCAVLLGAAPSVRAQETLQPRTTLLPTTHTREINLAGSLFLDGDKPFALSGTYGVFTSPKLEVGATGTVAGANHSSTLTAVGAFADYYLRGDDSVENVNPLLPYLGVFAGYSHKDGSDVSLGGQAGVKYFLNSNVAVTAEYQYRSTRHGNGTNEVVLGFSTFFR